MLMGICLRSGGGPALRMVPRMAAAEAASPPNQATTITTTTPLARRPAPLLMRDLLGDCVGDCLAIWGRRCRSTLVRMRAGRRIRDSEAGRPRRGQDTRGRGIRA